MNRTLVALSLGAFAAFAAPSTAHADNRSGYGFVGISASPSFVGLLNTSEAADALYVGFALEPRLRVGYALTSGVQLYGALGYTGINYLFGAPTNAQGRSNAGAAAPAAGLRPATQVPLSASVGLSLRIAQTDASSSANSATPTAGLYISFGIGYANLPLDGDFVPDSSTRFMQGLSFMISIDAAAGFRIGN